MKTLSGEPRVRFALTRDDIIGEPSYTKSSNLGVAQFINDYPDDIVHSVADQAQALRYRVAEKKQLNLKFIRDAQDHIPEIAEIVNAPGRLDMLSEMAGVKLEVYPLSIISTIITFQNVEPSEGSIVWHTDGIPITEMIPLSIDDLSGGELEIFRGNPEVGLSRVHAGDPITSSETIRIEHLKGYSILGQLMRTMHRVTPILRGSRITLNMNLRSVDRPYIDDNNMCYLAADNPDTAWQDEYISDIRSHVLPKYLENHATA